MDFLLAGRSETQSQLLQVCQGQLSASDEQRDFHEDIMDSLLAGRSVAQAQEDQRAAELKRVREEEVRVRRGL